MNRPSPSALLATVAGFAVGAAPFLCLLASGGGPSSYVILPISAACGAAGYRAPLAWAAAACVGVLAGWALWTALLGAGWKILVYVAILWGYVCAPAVLVLVLLVFASHDTP
jgi:hypothetical protein